MKKGQRSFLLMRQEEGGGALVAATDASGHLMEYSGQTEKDAARLAFNACMRRSEQRAKMLNVWRRTARSRIPLADALADDLAALDRHLASTRAAFPEAFRKSYEVFLPQETLAAGTEAHEAAKRVRGASLFKLFQDPKFAVAGEAAVDIRDWNELLRRGLRLFETLVATFRQRFYGRVLDDATLGALGAPDDRFYFCIFHSITMAEVSLGGIGAPKMYLCCNQRNKAPTPVELLRTIVNKTRILLVSQKHADTWRGMPSHDRTQATNSQRKTLDHISQTKRYMRGGGGLNDYRTFREARRDVDGAGAADELDTTNIHRAECVRKGTSA